MWAMISIMCSNSEKFQKVSLLVTKMNTIRKAKAELQGKLIHNIHKLKDKNAV